MSNPNACYLESPTYLALSEGWEDYFSFVESQGFVYEGSTCPGKQIHVVSLILNTHAQLVYEIGFNAGHMSFRMCKALEETGGTLIAFDIDTSHLPAAEKMKELFPSSFSQCIWGDTRNTLPLREDSVDLVHVDGGHSLEVAASDIREAKRLVRPGGFIVIDDCQNCSPPWQAAKDILGEERLMYFDHKFCYGDAFAVYRSEN